jgi:molybdopterin molybdotransferase
MMRMISVNEAKHSIIANSALLPAERKELSAAVNYILAEDISAPISLPSFRQSSMDGYALHHEDIFSANNALHISSEAKAGESKVQFVERGSAIRIFTGAPVPQGASAVVMQEHTVREGDKILISEFPVAEGKNIRHIGQQIKCGDIALSSGTLLSAGGVGFLAGLNVGHAMVYRKPRVGILITGDELVVAGGEIGHGQIYESNSLMLQAALSREGIHEISVLQANDNLEATKEALASLYQENDVILTSGGISVGDYDFVGAALRELSVETIFYKVKQKPGKPLLFGKKEQKLFFALPGNPASSLVCYYEYVLPAIRAISGWKDCFLKSVKLPIAKGYSFTGERDEFLKALMTENGVVPLDGQESFALRSFALADAIIYLPATQNDVKEGDLVEVHLIPR